MAASKNTQGNFSLEPISKEHFLLSPNAKYKQQKVTFVEITFE